MRLAAQHHHRDGAFLRDAGHEVVDAGVAPGGELLRRDAALGDRIVDRDDVPAHQAGAQIGAARQPHRHAPVLESGRGDRREVARAARRQRREHQCHAIDQQRLPNARDQALAQPEQVEVAVEIAGEPDQRAAIVVAVAVVDPVERRLNGVLDRARQQDHHERRQHRDDRVVLVLGRHQQPARHLEEDRVDGRDRRDGSRVDQTALDDHLDIHQPVPHDGRGEGQRDQAEQNRGELHAGQRVEPGRPRQRVPEHEGQAAQQRAPRDPPELAARGHRPDPAERPNHEGQPDHQIAGQDQQFQPIDRRQHARRQGAAAGSARDDRHARPPQQQRRQVRKRQQRAARVGHRPRVGPIREDQGEVQEHRRQRQQRHHVGPVEEPVERVELPAVREGHHAEESDRQPEEMERRLVAGPPQAHRGADQQREDADAGEHVVQRKVADGNRVDGDRDRRGG